METTVSVVPHDDITVEITIKVSAPQAEYAAALREVFHTTFSHNVLSADHDGIPTGLEQSTHGVEGKRSGALSLMTSNELETLWGPISDGAQTALKEMSTRAAQPGGYPKTELYDALQPLAPHPDRLVSGSLSSVGIQRKALQLGHRFLPYDASGDRFTMTPEVAAIIQRLPLRKP